MQSFMNSTTTCIDSASGSVCVQTQSDVLIVSSPSIELGIALLIGMFIILFITYVFNHR